MLDPGQLQRQLRVALQSGNYEEAILCLEQAASTAHEAKDRAAEGRHLGNLALIYNRLQRPGDALYYFEQALALARADNDRITEDGLLGNMGNILRELQRFDEAIDHLNQALLIAQESSRLPCSIYRDRAAATGLARSGAAVGKIGQYLAEYPKL
jgi:tetratricopeptide (TPR) repeat protein